MSEFSCTQGVKTSDFTPEHADLWLHRGDTVSTSKKRRTQGIKGEGSC